MDGFNTFEKQDKVLLGLNSGADAAAAYRILQQQGFAVLTFTAEDTADSPAAPATLLPLLAEQAAKLDCAFIATGHYARIEVTRAACPTSLPLWMPRLTRVPCWLTCRRNCWPSWCCPWASSARRMPPRSPLPKRNDLAAKVKQNTQKADVPQRVHLLLFCDYFLKNGVKSKVAK